MQKELLLIIPAYNEAKNIEAVVDNLTANYPEYDYIVVNDGSRDATGDICRRRGYHFLDMQINIGLTGGVQAGMMYAHRRGYKYAMQFDGDGQHDPAFIAQLLTKMKENPDTDIVIGSRFVTEKKPFTARMMGSFLIGGFLRLTTGKRIKDPTSGMRLFGAKAIRALAETADYGPEPDTIAHLIRSGAKVMEVQVSMKDRMAGESYLSFGRSIRYMAHMCLSIMFIQFCRKKPTYFKKNEKGENK
jgi:glycosyltransferase involved in cell wall biosynthesis